MNEKPILPHDDENPPWTSEMFARAKRGSEVMPPEVLEAFKTARAQDRAASNRPVSIRLDPDVLDYFKRSGAGWQSRINAALRAAMKAGG